VDLDFEFSYRRVLLAPVRVALGVGTRLRDGFGEIGRSTGGGVCRAVCGLRGPEGVFARTWSTGAVALCRVVALWGFLLLYFWKR
jgi:hypothetical protein